MATPTHPMPDRPDLVDVTAPPSFGIDPGGPHADRARDAVAALEAAGYAVNAGGFTSADNCAGFRCYPNGTGGRSVGFQYWPTSFGSHACAVFRLPPDAAPEDYAHVEAHVDASVGLHTHLWFDLDGPDAPDVVDVVDACVRVLRAVRGR